MNTDSEKRAGSPEPGTDSATARLKHDIEQTRAEMSATITALETRLSPPEIREKVGIELQHLEDRVRTVVHEQLTEAKTLVQSELVEAKNLLRDEMNEAEEKLRRGLGEAKETVKQELAEAFTRAKKSVRAATLGKVEDLATDLGDKMNETRETLVETVRSNPVPAAVMGVGLAWLLMNRSKSVRAYGSAGPRYRTGDDRQGGAGDVVGQVGSAVGQASAAVGKVAQQATDAVGHGLRQASDTAGQVVHGASDTAAALAQKAGDAASQLTHQAGDAAASVAGRARKGAKRVQMGYRKTLQQTPMAVGAAALAVGAVVGFAVPRTPGEDALMGETRDRVLRQAGEAVHDAAASVAHLAE